MKSILVTTAVLLSTNCFGKITYPLLNIYNAVDKETSKMDLIEDDEGRAEALRKETPGHPEKDQTFDLKQITRGIVLQEKKGYDIVTLKGYNIDYERGGELKIEFLVNAVTDNRKRKDFKIQKDPDGWKMYHNGQAIKVMTFVGNKVPFVGLVGVKEIKMRYEGEKDQVTEVFAEEPDPRLLKEIASDDVTIERASAEEAAFEEDEEEVLDI